jgi:hypothetical protein
LTTSWAFATAVYGLFGAGVIAMKFGIALVFLGFLASACATSPAVSTGTTTYRPAFDPRSWHSAIAGPPTKVATLGSTHLSQSSGTFDVATLEPLLVKLAAFDPNIITHEGLSGEQCELAQRYDKIYPKIFEDYCWGVEEGGKATGLTLPQARAEAEALLKTWPTAPTAAQRRRLSALFLASGDRPSAQVQWLQLPVAERVIGEGIDAALLAILDRTGKKPNETYEIGVVLAARLGLNRVYAVDDHTSDSIQAAAPEGLDAAIQAHWASSAPIMARNPIFAKMEADEKDMTSGDKVLAAYRFLNAPETQRAFIDLDFKRALATPSPQLFGRQYVSWYEVRNLRMVANIRSAFGNSPGARVLNIVGASHKAYYEAYLSQMSEVELVDMATILR